MKKMRLALTLLVLACCLSTIAQTRRTPARRTTTTAAATNLTPLERQVVGNHMLSLQWISWDYFGTAKITKEADGRLKCVGEQLSKEYPGDYLKLDGYITIVDALHLQFTGTIKTKVYHLNNGEEYVREGTFDFKSTQGRKYWREQEMKGPDGVTDYVDIYFKRK
ncbi:MAG: hypothetical protein IJP75_07725 [Bacteroidaceae bacterium]|nr:hypothetical protein [Bacteroidaceae bacterium]